MTIAPEIRTEIATANLSRSVPFQIVRDESDPGDGLTFRGYAAVFNEPTVIDSWEGRFEEVVLPGAFAKTLRERTPVFQFDHGTHPMIGSIPLGAIREAHEDDKGVYVDARLHDNWLVQPVRDAIASKSVDGMSFRFSVVRDRWEMDGSQLRSSDEILAAISRTDGPMPRRSLVELKAPEMGPVVFPAYAGTSAGVRSVTIDLTGDMGDEDRKALARAVFAADAATTNSPETPEDTSDEAVDHETRDTEPPQDTAESAVEHGAEDAGSQDTGPSDVQAWRDRNSRPVIEHSLRKELP